MTAAHGEGFRHEAMVYAGDEDFLAGAAPFVRDAVDAREPVLVAVSARKIDLLRTALGAAAGHVRFVDMSGIGANPARIIPLWREFVHRHGDRGRRLRGVGEPVWPGRSAAALAECYRHESLLNLAFDDGPAWSLLCPYDGGALDRHVVGQALRAHPFVQHGSDHRENAGYRAPNSAAPMDEWALPEAPAGTLEVALDGDWAGTVARLVRTEAAAARLGEARTSDLVTAVRAVVRDRLDAGAGRCTLRTWHDGRTVTCEIRDPLRITDPLAGRRTPLAGEEGSRGLWLANQVCDLVELRTLSTGSVSRLHMTVGG